jgi:hypothetical protein
MSRHRNDPLRPLTADERIALTRLSRSPSAPAAHVERSWLRISLIPPGVSVHSATYGGFTFADLSARCPLLGSQAVSDQGCRLRLWGSPVKPAAIRRRRTRPRGRSRRQPASCASSRL